MNLSSHRYFGLVIALLTSLAALLSSLFLNQDFLFHFVEEGGFIETLTLVFYIIAALFVLFYPTQTIRLQSRLSIAIIMLAMFAREKDLHKVFGMSMLKIKFWLTNEPTAAHKLYAACILLFLIFVLYTLIKHSIKSWFSNLKRREAYAITVVVFFAVLVISKIFDRSVNMIREITGWVAPIWVDAVQLPQEEYLECLLPVLVIIAVTQYNQLKKQTFL